MIPLAPIGERIDAILLSMEVASEQSVGNERADCSAERVEVDLSGELDGVVVLEGPVAALAPDCYGMLYDEPDVAVPHEPIVADPLGRHALPPGPDAAGPRIDARGRFEASDGAGVTFLLPGRTDWNGKLFVVHGGSGVYTPLAPLGERGAAGRFALGTGFNLFTAIMLDRGYAVAHLRRDAVRPPEGISRVVAGGASVRTTHRTHVGQAAAFTEFAGRYVERRFGVRPSRTYWYGLSSGAIMGRLLNYVPGANVRADGMRRIDGFIEDDVGVGHYLPIAYDADGRDYMLELEVDRAAFVPQIELAHAAYHPELFLPGKRLNARMLEEKGVAWQHRYYEVLGVSHFDAGVASWAKEHLQPFEVQDGDIIDLGGLIAGTIGLLESWVEDGVEPPPSRADARGFEPPLALPEVACPLGAFRPGDGPGPAGAMRTVLVPFERGVKDAWQRLGLLGAGESFTPERYAERLSDAAASLVEQGFLPAGMAEWYASEAPRLLEATIAAQ